MLVIGDSVMRLAEHDLRRRIRHRLVFEAEVNRQVVRTTTSPDGSTPVPSAVEVARDVTARQRVDLAIFHLGHNGQIVDDGFERLVAAVPDAPLCFVTLNEPRHWERPNNDVIVRGVARHERAHLLDWKAISTGRPFFHEDRLHVNEAGSAALADLVARACDQHLGPGPWWGRPDLWQDARGLAGRYQRGIRRRIPGSRLR